MDTVENVKILIVHDDTDVVKFCIKELRNSLSCVTPGVYFESCCLWDFKEDMFIINQNLLIMLSNKAETFCNIIYRSLIEKQRLFLATSARVCVVIETLNPVIEECFERVIGRHSAACVHDLLNTFAWLPKVCTFIYQSNNPKKFLQRCVIPKVVNDINLEHFRQSLIHCLRDLDVRVSANIDKLHSFKCGILIRKSKKEPMDKPTSKTVKISERAGALMFDYIVHHEGKHKRRLTYGKTSQVLFIVHLLFVLGLTDIVTINGRRYKRRVSRIWAIWENLAGVDLTGCLVLSLLNPGLLFYMFTPIPYIVLELSRITGRKQLWTICLTIWMIMSLLSMYGVIFYFVARADFFVYAIAGFWILFILSSVCSYALVKTVAGMINTLHELYLI